MKRILVALALLVIAGFAFAATAVDNSQVVTLTVAEVAMVGLNLAGNITLNVVAPATAGLAPVGQTDSTKYLRYTAVNAGVLTRFVTAQMSVAAPSGTQLTLTALPGIATAGQGTGLSVTLSTTAQNVISGIGSCYTGVGVTDGAKLTFSFVVVDPTLLVVDTAGVNETITLTLLDAA